MSILLYNERNDRNNKVYKKVYIFCLITNIELEIIN